MWILFLSRESLIIENGSVAQLDRAAAFALILKSINRSLSKETWNNEGPLNEES